MRPLVLFVGKSASGKDTIAREFEKNGFQVLTPCTTRPMRIEETEGNPYHFISTHEIDSEMIAKTEFKTKHGIWYYGFSNESLDPEMSYMAVVNPAQIEELYDRYRKTHRIVLMVIHPKSEEDRIIHAILREKNNGKDYEELCRRIVSDSADFAGYVFEKEANTIWNDIHCRRIVDHTFYMENDYQKQPHDIADACHKLVTNYCERSW